MYYITINIYFINLTTYYVSSIIYYIDIVMDYNKRHILIINMILMIYIYIYYITKAQNICTH